MLKVKVSIKKLVEVLFKCIISEKKTCKIMFLFYCFNCPPKIYSMCSNNVIMSQWYKPFNLMLQTALLIWVVRINNLNLLVVFNL